MNVVFSTQHIHVHVQHSQATITEFIPLALEVVYRHLLLGVLLLEVGPLGPERRIAAQKSNHLRPVGGEGSSLLSIPIPHPQRNNSHGTLLSCPAPPPHSIHTWSHPTKPAPFDTHQPETGYTPPQTPEPPGNRSGEWHDTRCRFGFSQTSAQTQVYNTVTCVGLLLYMY